MSKAGKKLLAAADEMVQIAKGEIPAARIWQNGHAYVPEERVADLEAKVGWLKDMLAHSDNFIVSKGLWPEFIEGKKDEPSPTAPECVTGRGG
jgi:hypothetical protein